MSETPTEPERRTTSSADWFTPESLAIIGFTLAVLDLRGQPAWATAVQALLLGLGDDSGSFVHAMLWFSVVGALVAVAAILLARRVVAAPGARWADHLARATIVLASLGLLLSVVTAVGALVNG